MLHLHLPVPDTAEVKMSGFPENIFGMTGTEELPTSVAAVDHGMFKCRFGGLESNVVEFGRVVADGMGVNE